MSTARSIDDVHNKIISKIPNHEYDLRQELNEYINSLNHLSPQAKKGKRVFKKYQNILKNYIDPLISIVLQQWEVDVIDIFLNVYSEPESDSEDANYYDYKDIGMSGANQVYYNC